MSNTSTLKDGGLAFPSEFGGGMSLRDWLAGQALAGLLANPETHKERIKLSEKDGGQDIVRMATSIACYAMADQMIAVSSSTTATASEDLIHFLKERGLI